MKILLVTDPASPYGEDAFCRELVLRAPSRGHEAVMAEKVEACDADVVLINSFQAEPIRAARSAGRKVAVRLIDSFAEVSPSELPAILGVLRQADRILVPSRYLADLARSWGVDGKTLPVPYAYDR
ncbi:MAG: hypothetical protein PHU21_14640, partial [Elusimicrobia bacterium]|nr:hypothetical protein [Elusimicrobiota bacterium]